MAKSWSLRIGGVQLSTGDGDPGEAEPETPFRILLLGDFSGAKSKAALRERKPIEVDRDNLDEVLARFAPEVKVPLGPNPRETAHLVFREMDDFEPDHLFRTCGVFESLASLRGRLHDPARFAQAAAEIKGWATVAKIPDAPKTETTVSPENVLAHILGESPAPETSDWQRFLRKIVEPHLVARTDPRLPDFEAVVDEAISAQMRAILHHPSFQTLEAAWRSVFFLVRRLETDEKLKLFLLDVTREELADELTSADDLGDTACYRHLVEQTIGVQGGEPWAVIAGLFSVRPTQRDLESLAYLATIVARAGSAFVAGAHPGLVGCASLAQTPDPREWKVADEVRDAWQQVRNLAEANHVGLTLPRFLLRLPYGQDAKTTETFAFEEMPAGSPHENYLWGSGAVACALLLGQSFARSGWGLHPGEIQEVGELPVHLCDDAGERVTKAVAEVLMSNRALERLLDAGLMPLLSVKDRGALQVARFQSIAAPAAPLAGRWQA